MVLPQAALRLHGVKAVPPLCGSFLRLSRQVIGCWLRVMGWSLCGCVSDCGYVSAAFVWLTSGGFKVIFQTNS